MVVIAFSALTFLHADAMASHEPVARLTLRLQSRFSGAHDCFVQFAVFDPRPFLTKPVLPARLSHAHRCLRIPGLRLRKGGDMKPRIVLAGERFIDNRFAISDFEKITKSDRAHSRGIESARRPP